MLSLLRPMLLQLLHHTACGACPAACSPAFLLLSQLLWWGAVAV